jgi:adenine C2-methylase RlmN of 23S rRNA A2503 and tRNA A37
MAVGVDGVDIGTTFPNFYDDIVRDNLYVTVSELREIISKYRINPKSSYSDHNGIRLFFSLHSFDNDIRKSLIPKPVNADVIDIIGFLKDFSYTMGIGLIFHQMFIAGINDSEQHVGSFIYLYRTFCDGYELRILKFNECEYSDFKCPSDKEYNKILNNITRSILFTKVQFSAGSELKASCGQFLMSKKERN